MFGYDPRIKKHREQRHHHDRPTNEIAKQGDQAEGPSWPAPRRERLKITTNTVT